MLSFSHFNEQLVEGVDDPGILKCVFMAGGPGSGKSFVAGQLFGIAPKIRASFSSFGLKLINSDTNFEHLLKQNGISPKDLDALHKASYTDPGPYNHAMNLRNRAKDMTATQQKQYQAGRLGMIVDGTGRIASEITNKADHARSLGYDCFMIFVNTSLETALRRNNERARTVPEKVVRDSWQDCQDNIAEYQHYFGMNRFRIVDNDDGSTPQIISKTIHQWMNLPVQNQIGHDWIKMMGGRHGR